MAEIINQITYNVLIDRFKAFADGHEIVKHFSHGVPGDFDMQKFGQYPAMHVFPTQFSYGIGAKTVDLTIYIFDKPRQTEEKDNNIKEVVSDCQQIGEDLISTLTRDEIMFGDRVSVLGSPTMSPASEEYGNVLSGVIIELTLEIPWQANLCGLPLSWSTGGSGSGSPQQANGIVIKVNGVETVLQDLIDFTDGTNVTIADLGDGRIRFTATGGGGGGLTCEDLAACQTIIDLDTAIDAVALSLSSHIANTSNPHSVTKSQVGLSNVDNTSDINKPVSTAQQTALDLKVDENAAITGATKTKITYDAKGLVTAGADIVASDISDSTTVGQNIVKIISQAAVRYVRINADGSVDAISAATLASELGADLYGGILVGTPAATGFSVKTEDSLRYNRPSGSKICHVIIRIIGTSNAATFTITLPFAAANTAVQRIAMNVTSNGVNSVGYLSTAANSTTATLTLGTGGAFNAAGTKAAIGNGLYETT